MSTKTPALRWVACSRDASYSASLHRHLITPGAHTTLCGNTASVPEVWRGNTTKPDCPRCLTIQNLSTSPEGTP